MKYKTNMLKSYTPPLTISILEAERVGEILNKQEGTHLKFFRFLHLSRFSIAYTSDNGQSRIISGESAKRILTQESL
jgi:hypothetical protein